MSLMSKNPLSFFCRYMNPKFFAEREFLDDVLDDIWEFLIQNEKELLMINLPQGAGKSYLATLISAFLIGFENYISIMRITNTQSNADGFTIQTSVILNSIEFLRFFPHFPKLAHDNKTTVQLAGNWNFSLKGVGVGTSTMGLRTRFFIIDDIYLDFSDAMKSGVTSKLKDKWELDWHGRREGSGAKIICVGTRYAKADFYNYLETNLSLFKKIVVPALNENNESFCEIVRTTDDLLRARERNHPDWFNAVFQQNPTAEGAIMLFEHFTPIVEDLKGMKFDKLYSIADPSMGVGSDFFACGIFGIIGKQIFLIDLLLERTIEFVDYYDFVKKYPTRFNFIEKNGIGSFILRDAHKNKVAVKLHPFTSKGDKYSRIFAEKEEIKKIIFNVSIQKDSFSQLIEFPENENDDFPDMLAHATRILANYM